MVSKIRGLDTVAEDLSDNGRPHSTSLIPPLIRECIRYLIPRVRTKGLFRVPGNAADMKALLKRFSDGKSVDIDRVTHVHSIAGLIPLFLREQPPLCPELLFDCFMAAVEVPEDALQLSCLRKVVRLLPTSNFFILVVVLEFLKVVALHSADNQMSSYNLAVVFAPVLLRPPVAFLCDPLAMVSLTQKAVSAVQILIDSVFSIFALKHLADSEESPDPRTISPDQNAPSSDLSAAASLPNASPAPPLPAPALPAPEKVSPAHSSPRWSPAPSPPPVLDPRIVFGDAPAPPPGVTVVSRTPSKPALQPSLKVVDLLKHFRQTMQLQSIRIANSTSASSLEPSSGSLDSPPTSLVLSPDLSKIAERWAQEGYLAPLPDRPPSPEAPPEPISFTSSLEKSTTTTATTEASSTLSPVGDPTLPGRGSFLQSMILLNNETQVINTYTRIRTMQLRKHFEVLHQNSVSQATASARKPPSKQSPTSGIEMRAAGSYLRTNLPATRTSPGAKLQEAKPVSKVKFGSRAKAGSSPTSPNPISTPEPAQDPPSKSEG